MRASCSCSTCESPQGVATGYLWMSVGKQADIISVNGSPLKNIDVLKNVQFVMKAGQVYKQ